MFEFLALGGIAFWIILVIISGFIISCVQSEDGTAFGFTAFLTALFIAIYYKTIISFSLTAIIITILAYAACGGVWSIIRWYRYTRKIVNAVKAGELRNPGSISVNAHRVEITSWIVFWPWSIFWEVTGGLLENLWDMLVGTFRRIAARANNDLASLNKK